MGHRKDFKVRLSWLAQLTGLSITTTVRVVKRGLRVTDFITDTLVSNELTRMSTVLTEGFQQQFENGA